MNKKQISRRGFLKGIGQTTVAAVLANILKFVPEAQGVLARQASLGKNDVAITPLSAARLDELASQLAEDANGKALQKFLDSQGFAETPNRNAGVRATITTEDETISEIDVLVFRAYDQTEERGVISWYGVGNSADLKNVRTLVAAISQQDAYIVQDGQVVVYENPPEALQSAIQQPSLFKVGSSGTYKRAQPARNHCCSAYQQCLAYLGICAVFIVCCWATGACCGPAFLACLSGNAWCAILYDCCGTGHGCNPACG